MLFMLSCMLFSAESNDSFLIEKLLKILTMYSVEQLFLALHYLQLLFINKMKKKIEYTHFVKVFITELGGFN